MTYEQANTIGGQIESINVQIFNSQIKERDIVLTVGLDGAGKSVLLNSLISGPTKMYRNENFDIESKEVLIYDGLP